jgi:hypothetical protein
MNWIGIVGVARIPGTLGDPGAVLGECAARDWKKGRYSKNVLFFASLRMTAF